MLVPDNWPQPVGIDERMPTPGAATSGLRRSESGVGPDDEKSAITPAVPLSGVETAPTVIAFADEPGDVSEPRPKS